MPLLVDEPEYLVSEDQLESLQVQQFARLTGEMLLLPLSDLLLSPGDGAKRTRVV